MLRTINELIVSAATLQPENTAVTYKDQSMTYAEVYEQACMLASVLMEMGIRRGDRVCCYLEKRFEKVVTVFAVSLAGAVFVPIRWVARPHQTFHILGNSGARVLITTAQKLSLLKEYPLKISGVVVLDKVACSVPENLPVCYWPDIFAGGEIDWSGPDVIAKDLAALLYTSGSSGMPKGVVLTHANIMAGAYSVAQYLKINEHDRLLSYLSFGFDYGLNQLMTTFLRRAHLILFNYLFPKDILKAVEHYQITGLAAVSATWIQLLQIPWGNSCRSLRYITNSGGAIPVRLVRELRRRIPQTEIFLMYGLTEAFRSTYLDPEMIDEHPGSIGKAVPGEEILVLDEDNHPVGSGETGELVHRGALVSQGYWQDKGKSNKVFRPYPFQPKEVFDQELVVFSGDYVRIDEDGYLYFEGRRDEMIKSAGNRISPTEVEEILYNSGLIADVVAFGIPHESYGQVVCIVVSDLPESPVDVKKICTFCQGSMPSYMVPARIEKLVEMPRNANGKLDRAMIKKQFYAVGEAQ